MFFETPVTYGPTVQNFDDLAAIITLILMGCLVHVLTHTKPTIQRAMLRIMFQPILATTLFLSLWMVGRILSLTFAH